MSRFVIPVLSLLALGLLLVGGGIPPVSAQTPTEPTSDVPLITLNLWIPDALVRPNTAAYDTLLDQVIAFEAQNPTVRVDLRVRAVGDGGVADPGGLLYGLRTAAAVAPDALPDLTLLRRADLVAADAFGVLLPLNAFDEAAPDLPAALARLAVLDGQVVGLPYTVDFEHMVYQAPPPFDGDTPTNVTFLEAGIPFTFPANRPTMPPDIFLAQYADAIAALDTLEPLPLNANGLRQTYTFYEQAVNDALILPESISYDSYSDYADAIADGDIPAAVLPSALYLRATSDSRRPLAYSALPTASGIPVITIDGWMWVVTARAAIRDPARQAAVSQLLNWLFQPERQFLITQSVPVLPSRVGALRLWADADYADFALRMIERGLTPPDVVSPTLRAITTSLIAILNGDRSAVQAVRDVVAQVGGTGS